MDSAMPCKSTKRLRTSTSRHPQERCSDKHWREVIPCDGNIKWNKTWKITRENNRGDGQKYVYIIEKYLHNEATFSSPTLEYHFLQKWIQKKQRLLLILVPQCIRWAKKSWHEKHCATVPSISTPYDCDCGEWAERNRRGSNSFCQRRGYVRDLILSLGTLCEETGYCKTPIERRLRQALAGRDSVRG